MTAPFVRWLAPLTFAIWNLTGASLVDSLQLGQTLRLELADGDGVTATNKCIGRDVIRQAGWFLNLPVASCVLC